MPSHHSSRGRFAARLNSLGDLNTMLTGVCRLCLELRPLCNSHALPNSLFNYILRKNDGKAIVVTDDETTPVQYSTDTWETELLCANCEARLNSRFDAYGISVFRGHQCGVLRDQTGVTLLRIDYRRLRMFFLSVLWRISVSTHDSYTNIDLPRDWEEDLRLALHAGRTIPASRYTVAIFRMRDSTKEGGFNDEVLKNLITAPFARSYGNFVSICFPFLGFFVEAFMPKVPERFARRPGILRTGPVHFAPYMEVLDIPEFMALFVRGLKKHNEGLTRVA